jgi:hypothetical protein
VNKPEAPPSSAWYKSGETDQKKGWGFTGYSYFYNNYWTSFPKPFSQMSNTERAQQCKQQFES